MIDEKLAYAVQSGLKYWGIDNIISNCNSQSREYNKEQLIVDCVRVGEPRLALEIPCFIYKHELDFRQLHERSKVHQKLAQVGTFLDICEQIFPNDYGYWEDLQDELKSLDQINFEPSQFYDWEPSEFFQNNSLNRFKIYFDDSIDEYRQHFEWYALGMRPRIGTSRLLLSEEKRAS